MTPEYWQERTQLLLGSTIIEQLQQKHILIAGLGGVGAYAAESLARAGIGHFTIVDADSIRPSNINRQLLATTLTVGQPKVQLMKHRILAINPQAVVNEQAIFINDVQTQTLLSATHFDYVVDAIDTLMPKVHLIANSLKHNIPVASSLGAGGKLNPTLVEVADISQTHHCKLGRMLRKRLHKLGIRTGFQTVFSPEAINKEAILPVEEEKNKNNTVGTISYMPAIFGLNLAAIVLQDFIKTHKEHDIIGIS